MCVDITVNIPKSELHNPDIDRKYNDLYVMDLLVFYLYEYDGNKTFFNRNNHIKHLQCIDLIWNQYISEKYPQKYPYIYDEYDERLQD